VSALVFSDPASRAVAEDALREAGLWSLRAWQWRLGVRADADAYAYANADANADAYAYAYAYADAYAVTTLKEDDMKDGLYAAQLWSGNVMVLRVGWFRRDAGDDYDVWWTTPYRGETTTRLATVWAEGPKKAAPRWTWSPVLASTASRLHFVPLARLDPKLWEGVCPKPGDFDR